MRIKSGKKPQLQNIIYWIASIIGGIFLMYTIEIFNDTIVDIKTIFVVFCIIGLLASCLDWKRFNDTYNHFIIPKIFVVFFLNTLFWGSFILFIFFKTNTHFKLENIQEHLCKIVSSEFLPAKTGKHKTPPLYAFTVDCKNRIEYVTFPVAPLDIENYKHIKFYTQKGFWGYDIITAKILLLE